MASRHRNKFFVNIRGVFIKIAISLLSEEMTFSELLKLIANAAGSSNSFLSVCQKIEELIFKMDAASLPDLVVEIGSIPESINHDSSSEKMFAKAADIILARCLRELRIRTPGYC